jgi:hypothetical protein
MVGVARRHAHAALETGAISEIRIEQRIVGDESVAAVLIGENLHERRAILAGADDDLVAVAAGGFDVAGGDKHAPRVLRRISVERFQRGLIRDGTIVIGVREDLHFRRGARSTADDELIAQAAVRVSQRDARAAFERPKRQEEVSQVVGQEAVVVDIGKHLDHGLADVGR